MNRIYFRPDYQSGSMSYKISDQIPYSLPDNTQALIIKYQLSDINVRKHFSQLLLKQESSNNIIDLSSYFILGPQIIPSFGMSTELIIPWDMKAN